jgi:hypothetical protein
MKAQRQERANFRALQQLVGGGGSMAPVDASLQRSMAVASSSEDALFSCEPGVAVKLEASEGIGDELGVAASAPLTPSRTPSCGTHMLAVRSRLLCSSREFHTSCTEDCITLNRRSCFCTTPYSTRHK